MMDLSTIIHEYISIITVIAGLGVGYTIMQTPSLKEKLKDYIPLIVGVLGILISVLSDGLGVHQVVVGLTSGLASTGMYEAYKNVLSGDQSNS